MSPCQLHSTKPISTKRDKKHDILKQQIEKCHACTSLSHDDVCPQVLQVPWMQQPLRCYRLRMRMWQTGSSIENILSHPSCEIDSSTLLDKPNVSRLFPSIVLVMPKGFVFNNACLSLCFACAKCGSPIGPSSHRVLFDATHLFSIPKNNNAKD